jgi:hypothetical protein
VGWTAPPLDGVPSPLTLARSEERAGLWSLAVGKKRRFSEEIACSFEVFSLLNDLVTVKTAAT